MKKHLLLFSLILIALSSCKKDNSAPSVQKPTIADILSNYIFSTAVQTLGSVTADGGAPITARGVCWSTLSNPTLSDHFTNNGTGIGGYTSNITGLTINTTYYMRGYATNSAGTTYGTVYNVTTGYGIGEPYAGGIIFYIDNTKLHGLVVATSDQGSTKWDNTNGGTFLSPGAYSSTDGAGNTTKIYNAAGNNGNAAALCRAYRGGGYTDWFLPSSGQLTQVFNQTAALYTNTAMKPFAADYYWTSTESTSYIAFALCVQMYTGTLYSDFKTNGYPVRAIRAF